MNCLSISSKKFKKIFKSKTVIINKQETRKSINQYAKKQKNKNNLKNTVIKKGFYRK